MGTAWEAEQAACAQAVEEVQRLESSGGFHERYVARLVRDVGIETQGFGKALRKRRILDGEVSLRPDGYRIDHRIVRVFEVIHHNDFDYDRYASLATDIEDSGYAFHLYVHNRHGVIAHRGARAFWRRTSVITGADAVWRGLQAKFPEHAEVIW